MCIMNFIHVFLLVLVSFTSFLWAKTSYYILPVQFEGVHEDNISKMKAMKLSPINLIAIFYCK